jgi:Sigma-70, region 4
VAVSRASIRLDFVAALQHLSARQRAVLILRDVLEWPAAEVAGLLGTTTTVVNSVLEVVRQAVDGQLARPAGAAADEQDLLAVQTAVAARFGRVGDPWRRLADPDGQAGRPAVTGTRPTGAGCAVCAAAAAGASCVAGAVTVRVAVCPALAGRKMTAASEPSRAAAMAASTAVSEPVMKACWAAWARIWPPALCDLRAAVSAAPREPVARA